MTTHDMNTIGVIGAGTMGAGVAQNVADHGFAVILVDRTAADAEAGKARIAKSLDKQVERGKRDAGSRDATLARVTTAGDFVALGDADLIVEAAFEDLEVKRKIYIELNALARPDALIATNTSSLRVSELAKRVQAPWRFAGLHYFNPAAVNPFIEIIRGAETADGTIDRLQAFAKAVGKQPIVCADANGFAVNRFFLPYGNEAARCLEEGLGTAGEIDAAAVDALKVAAGPVLVMNVVKPRIMLNAERYLAPFGAFYEPCDLLVKQGEADAPFEIDEPAAPAARAAEIADRLKAAVCFPILQALDEGVAEPADFDLGATVALKFGVEPCRMMDAMGADAVR
ncbi:MAG: 3-hydroxyacyl-CoA dehydrogenase family protein, partial [Pseudomonadota bacterium]